MSLKVMQLDPNSTDCLQRAPAHTESSGRHNRLTYSCLFSISAHMRMYIWRCWEGDERSGAAAAAAARARFQQVCGHETAKPAQASLNPLWLALCWNSHRLSKQSNSGSIRPSIGGIETELVVSRGQEILTRALCRLTAGGRTYTHI